MLPAKRADLPHPADQCKGSGESETQAQTRPLPAFRRFSLFSQLLTFLNSIWTAVTGENLPRQVQTLLAEESSFK